MKVTIKDVAELAKVHKSTVSRVLNNSNDVKEKTKQKVLQAIDTLGYSPNFAARSLASGKSHIIGFVVSEQQISDVVMNPSFPTILKGITTYAEELGYNILMITSVDNDYKSYEQVIRKHAVDGFIILGSTIQIDLNELLIQQGIPYIFIGKHHESADESYVGTDNIEGGYIAAKHLIDLGHTDIRLMVGQVRSQKILSHNIDRITGFKKAFAEAGLSFRDDYIVKTPTDMETGYHFMRTYFTSHEPSAVILSNEVMAMSCINYLSDERPDLLERMSIVTFGDSDFFRHLRPPLTTVSQHFEWIGRTAVEMLASQIAEDDMSTKAVVRKPDLVIRSSSKRK
ncbi:LacI family DNA-binding transcriptional regulator [Marinicrinis sediminis]|uniref:LacI family DNA-binding transcriptional regulator n=1 Tax=Marinicrinis sediminis TaxID=1652465 RepID=A0ABW5RBD8_9BACL